MKCSHPGFYPETGVFFPCGSCMPCRLARKHIWTGRMLLESQAHDNASFVTLTYDNDHLNLNDDGTLGCLDKRDYQLFIKRLRKQLEKLDVRIRYYGVGEYGEVSGRPHYHFIIFGVDFRVPFLKNLLHDCWNKGIIDVGEKGVNSDSISYVAGYITKKMTGKIDDRLFGRPPEFSTMSRGLGRCAVEKFVLDYISSRSTELSGSYMFGGKLYAYGRYLKKKILERLEDMGIVPDISQVLVENVRKCLLKCYEYWVIKGDYSQRMNADIIISRIGSIFSTSFKLMRWFAEPIIDHDALVRIKAIGKSMSMKRYL